MFSSRYLDAPGPSRLLPPLGFRGVEALERLEHHHPERHHAPAHSGFYLTECINQMVLESQLPHTIVNLLSYLVIENNKLTILFGS
jgi:hypothetical protein